MSWVDKEMKRRATVSKRTAPKQASATSAADRIQDLWARLERANAALPSELQLRLEPDDGEPSPTALEAIKFVMWLRAANGAALGFAGDAVRYFWPKPNRRRSNNFWIRWDTDKGRYVLSQRVGAGGPDVVSSYTFNEARAELMIKQLVLGKRVKVRAIRKKRLWVF